VEGRPRPGRAGGRSRCTSVRASRRSRPRCRISRRSSRIREEPRMPVLVRIPTALRRHTGGTGEIYAEGKDVGEVVTDLERKFPGLRDRLCDETGDFRRFINVYVNQEDVRFLQGLESLLKDGDEVSIVPAIAGGQ